MESGINARAIDFAKIGRLFLNGGNWSGNQVISGKWVNESTSLNTTTDPAPFYQYMWWVHPLSTDSTRYNFYAVGNHGQFIYVIPEKNMVIVKQGFESGYDNWTSLFQQLGTNN
jgi:CubicO group peptidase (beta-lactamase class C family)